MRARAGRGAESTQSGGEVLARASTEHVVRARATDALNHVAHGAFDAKIALDSRDGARTHHAAFFFLGGSNMTSNVTAGSMVRR